MESENIEANQANKEGISLYGGKYVQYNILGNLFEVSAKYAPPIHPVGRGAYGTVWVELLSLDLKSLAPKLNWVIKIKDIIKPADREKFNDVYIVYELMDTDLNQIIHSSQALTDDYCQVITVSKDDTIILDGAGGKKAIDERSEQIRSAIELSTSEYDKEKLQEDSQSFLVIGGASEAEVSEKKDRVTDALMPLRQPLKRVYRQYYNYLPFMHGGVAILYASKELEKLRTVNFDQKVGVQIIQNALKAPVHTIASNAGVEGAVVFGKLLEQHHADLAMMQPKVNMLI
ncbi:chaperonin CPN60-2 [Pyrus ussuriensis x Pyrus communis]|uniref:Chaperonin CPN60-2 n=1 Tax=Pyrus ussuriensis x Pyrus communis TaxID=2448454 RepID=A0A5N5G8C7_9ROSA|nr:chaperonin CPN60-2 [Pyrus ussuriensis x Pyrus communis]KAB2614718.1 chaperonin CPN60-2 [Pyrus ussuriensis x Pyrus communis]